MSGQTHTADARVLNQRTLEKDHRRLGATLRPGVSVLDIGCGTEAINAGIARVAGRVVGIDRDSTLIEQAKVLHPAANLSFIAGDVFGFETDERFDIVSGILAPLTGILAPLTDWEVSEERALVQYKVTA